MDIRKPKAIRNWREFLKEYAIIVIGVLTALGAEQAAETVHEHSRAAEARTHIRAEIANNLRLVNTRASTESCVAKRLDEVNGLIAASASGKLPNETIWIGTPLAYAMLDGRYKAATQSGAVSLFDDQEQEDYAVLYGFFAVYYELIVGEQKAWADLRMLDDRPPPSAALDVQLRSALKQARYNRYYIQMLHTQIVHMAAKSGIKLPPYEVVATESVCLPLHTPRDQALKAIIPNRYDKGTYDEP